MNLQRSIKCFGWLVWICLCLAVIHLWPNTWSRKDTWQRKSFLTWTELHPQTYGDVSFSSDGKTISIKGHGLATLVWEAKPGEHFGEVELISAANQAPFPREHLRLFYTWDVRSYDYLEYDQFIQARVAPRDDTIKGEQFRYRWIIPAQANRVALQWQGPVDWKLDRIELKQQGTQQNDALLAWVEWVPWLGMAGILLALTRLANKRWPNQQWLSDPKHFIVIGIGTTALVLAVLLPPFQGPDENRHWQAALSKHRWLGKQETALYYLPDALNALPLRWRGDIPFDAGLMRSLAAQEGNEQAEVNVGYANRLTYPAVALVSCMFPTVQTMGQALTFYYACRVLPILVLMVLLFWAAANHWLSYTLLLVISFPLFLQQIVVVTSDTLNILGTLATFFLFIRVRQRPTMACHVLLWLVAWWVTLAKPPTFLPLFPIIALPWRRIPYKPVWFIVACVLFPTVGWWVMQIGLKQIAASDPQVAEKIWKQLDFFKTWQGQKIFLRSVSDRLTYSDQVIDECYQPLGWLDTVLNERYRLLIYISLLLALLTDFSERSPMWLQQFQDKWLSWLGLMFLALMHAVLVILSICLIMYLTNSEVGQVGLVGVQIRYFFPAMLGLILLPMATRAADAQTDANAEQLVADGLTHWLGLLWLLLLFARGIELVGDLLFRYWR